MWKCMDETGKQYFIPHTSATHILPVAGDPYELELWPVGVYLCFNNWNDKRVTIFKKFCKGWLFPADTFLLDVLWTICHSYVCTNFMFYVLFIKMSQEIRLLRAFIKVKKFIITYPEPLSPYSQQGLWLF